MRAAPTTDTSRPSRPCAWSQGASARLMSGMTAHPRMATLRMLPTSMANAMPRPADGARARGRAWEIDPCADEVPGSILPAMPKSAWLAIDVAVKVAVVAFALYPLADPGSSHFAGKAMGGRALIYPAFTLMIPATWLLSRRPKPYPFLADIALGLPFAIDAGANVLGLFDISGFDALPHALGWFFLALSFGLAASPLLDKRWVAFLLVVGFGASIDILWEIGEYLLMKSGSSGLQLTYENTIQDLATSFLGGVLAAIVVATALWPARGTPRTLFGWQ
jgi:hypothetical protein